MQSANPTPAEHTIQNARCARLGLILGSSSLLLVLIVIGSLVTSLTDDYYRMFGYAIMITIVFLIMVIMKNPKPHRIQRSREGSFASLQVIENLPYSAGPPTYSELLAEDLLNSQRNGSGVGELAARHLEPSKHEPVPPPPSYDIAIGDNTDRIHSVSEVVPQICRDESRRALDQLPSTVFPTRGSGAIEGLPSYEDAVTWMVDQGEQPTHDQQNLIP